jgi:hypothetical protein
MSVSFYPEPSDKVAVKITCACGASEYPGVYANRVSAVNARNTMTNTCTDPYCDYLKIDEVLPEPEVNFSNTNAEELFSYLGFSDEELDYVGAMDADAFLGRVVLAKGLTPYNTGLTTMRVDNVIYGGRPSNYFQVRLDALENVARFAIQNNRKVVWG